jgi:hypothetical protein
MSNEELLEFIKKAREKKKSDEDITQLLLAVGWKREIIQKAFKQLSSDSTIAQKQVYISSLLEEEAEKKKEEKTIKAEESKPKEKEEVRKEEEIKTALNEEAENINKATESEKKDSKIAESKIAEKSIPKEKVSDLKTKLKEFFSSISISSISKFNIQEKKELLITVGFLLLILVITFYSYYALILENPKIKNKEESNYPKFNPIQNQTTIPNQTNNSNSKVQINSSENQEAIISIIGNSSSSVSNASGKLIK